MVEAQSVRRRAQSVAQSQDSVFDILVVLKNLRKLLLIQT